MFFYLSKVLDFLINPLVWILGFMLFALFSKKVVIKRKSLRIAVGLFIFLCMDLFSMWAMTAWEIQAAPIASIKNHQVAIVLGGFTVMEAKPYDRVHTNHEADRLLHAVQLYKLGKVEYILVTGGSASVWKIKGTEADMAHNLLLTCGVPESAILVENASHNTHENAQNSKALLQSKGLWGSEVILVTSAFHTRRAIACFEKEDYTVLPYPTSIRTKDIIWYNPAVYFIPSLDSLNRWNLLLHEWIGYLTYKLIGYC